jgi:hypothetical protein
MDTDGGNQRQITFDGANNLRPAWSPDSRELAFTSDRDGTTAIWAAPVDLRQPPRRISPGVRLRRGVVTPMTLNRSRSSRGMVALGLTLSPGPGSVRQPANACIVHSGNCPAATTSASPSVATVAPKPPAVVDSTMAAPTVAATATQPPPAPQQRRRARPPPPTPAHRDHPARAHALSSGGHPGLRAPPPGRDPDHHLRQHHRRDPGPTAAGGGGQPPARRLPDSASVRWPGGSAHRRLCVGRRAACWFRCPSRCRLQELPRFSVFYQLALPARAAPLGYSPRQANLGDWYPFIPPYRAWPGLADARAGRGGRASGLRRGRLPGGSYA